MAGKSDHGIRIMYIVLERREREINLKSGVMISAHYTGTFLDGRKFDSSVDKGDTSGISCRCRESY